MSHNVRDFLEEHYGDSLPTDDNPSDVTVGVTAVQLVTVNARRIKLRMCNFGGANVVFERDASVTATTGIQLSPGQTIELTAPEDFELVTKQLFGISSFAGNAIHIIETVMVGGDDTGDPQ
jgi:hypothetical protein